MKNLIPQERIQDKIYLIRDQKVMLDRDLAILYGVETRVLNQAVRRNIKRFPDEFLFSLTRKEIMNLSQIVISSKIKHAPNVFAFTEHGILMLSSVLNSERAIQVNIQIMRTFVRLKKDKDLQKRIEQLEKKVGIVFIAIKQLQEAPKSKTKKIGFITKVK